MTVTATVGTTAQVRQADDDLIAAGIPADAISAVTAAGQPIENLSPTATDVLGHLARDAGIGALIGGAAGLALAPLVLPGLGLLLVAGPLAFSGALAGSVVGGLIGAGHEAGDAETREEQLRAGRYLVVAHTDSPQARTVFELAGAAGVRVTPGS